MPLLMQLWMFASPVVYPLSAVPGWLRPFYMLNPMAGIIENFRRVMLHAEPPDFTALGVALIASLVLLALSYVYFKRVEATIADVI
jgi:lipopolysaccharide transport system permease protein